MPQKISSKIIDIDFKVDDLLLSGVLHLPSIENPPLIIGCHGLGADKESPKQIALAKAVNALKMAYFRFDHRGCGESEGDFVKVTTLNGRCRDLRASAEMIQSRYNIADRVGLFGSSMGGTVCLATAGDLNADAIVTLAAPVRLGQKPVPSAPEDDSPQLPLEFYKNNLPFDIADRLTGLHNILVIHGEADTVVPITNAHEIYAQASEPKQRLYFKDGDHRISNPRHQQQFIEAAAKWFASRLMA